MTTIFENNGIKVEASEPKTNNYGTCIAIYVNDSRTDARVYSDETLEEAMFNITSSSPVTDEDTARKVAQAALNFLK